MQIPRIILQPDLELNVNDDMFNLSGALHIGKITILTGHKLGIKALTSLLFNLFNNRCMIVERLRGKCTEKITYRPRFKVEGDLYLSVTYGKWWETFLVSVHDENTTIIRYVNSRSEYCDTSWAAERFKQHQMRMYYLHSTWVTLPFLMLDNYLSKLWKNEELVEELPKELYDTIRDIVELFNYGVKYRYITEYANNSIQFLGIRKEEYDALESSRLCPAYVEFCHTYFDMDNIDELIHHILYTYYEKHDTVKNCPNPEIIHHALLCYLLATLHTISYMEKDAKIGLIIEDFDNILSSEQVDYLLRGFAILEYAIRMTSIDPPPLANSRLIITVNKNETIELVKKNFNLKDYPDFIVINTVEKNENNIIVKPLKIE